jgi:septal ring factor EnvC (AmiA/AmiB activator)
MHRIAPILALPVLLLTAGCVSEEDVRTQVDQAKAELKGDLAAVKTESATRADQLASDLAASKKETERISTALAASDKRNRDLETQIAGMKADLQRISGDLSRSVQDLTRRVEASSGVFREHIKLQRNVVAEQLKALDKIIAGGETVAPSVAPTP